MKLALAIIVFALLATALASDQQAFLVFRGPREIRSVAITDHTTLSFPMVNGKPDMKRGNMQGLVVDVDHNLGRIELR